MKWRNVATVFLLVTSLSASSALALSAADIDGVKAASKAFYDAVVVIDDGTAMEKVWARRLRHLRRSAQHLDHRRLDGAEKFNKAFAQRAVTLVGAHVHAVGDLAWEIGAEVGQAQMKDGTTRKVDWLVTNVYEKIYGRWLMVSHHVQPKPQ